MGPRQKENSKCLIKEFRNKVCDLYYVITTEYSTIIIV